MGTDSRHSVHIEIKCVRMPCTGACVRAVIRSFRPYFTIFSARISIMRRDGRSGTGVMANVDKPRKHQNSMNIWLAVKACVMGTIFRMGHICTCRAADRQPSALEIISLSAWNNFYWRTTKAVHKCVLWFIIQIDRIWRCDKCSSAIAIDPFLGALFACCAGRPSAETAQQTMYAETLLEQNTNARPKTIASTTIASVVCMWPKIDGDYRWQLIYGWEHTHIHTPTARISVWQIDRYDFDVNSMQLNEKKSCAYYGARQNSWEIYHKMFLCVFCVCVSERSGERATD